MPAKWNPLDLPDLISSYLSGESTKTLGPRYGVSPTTITNCLQRSGITTRNQRAAKYIGRIAPSNQAIINRYLSGLYVDQIAAQLGISESTVLRTLKRNGVQTRSKEESLRMRISQMTAAKRVDTFGAAKGSPGRIITLDERIKRARSKEGKIYVNSNSPDEATLNQWLNDAGITTIVNKAIGPYNADIGSSTVAMEIFGGNYHGSGPHATIFAQRCRYILNEGWSLVIIWCCKFFPLTRGACDYLIPFIEATRSNPAQGSQYRVIGGNGKELLTIEGDFDDVTLIPPGG